MKTSKFIFFTLIFSFLVCFPAKAQHHRMHPGIPVDSSYQLETEWIKQSKRYPFITKATVEESDSFRVFRNLVYQTIGSRELHLDVFQPTFSTEKTPVVVMVHGGGWRSGNKDMEHYMASAFARNGIAAVCVEYRLLLEASYPAALQDIKTAIRWTRRYAKKYHFDPEQVVIEGESAGGQIASLIGSRNDDFEKYRSNRYRRYSDRVQAAIDVDGVLAFLHPESSEVGNRGGKPSLAAIWLGKTPQEDSLIWAEASALTHAGKQSAPFLYINSSVPRFHAGQKDMTKKLKQNGVYFEEHLIAGSPHSFWLFHPWVDETIQVSVAFIRKVFAR